VWVLAKETIVLPLGCLQGREIIFIELMTSDRKLIDTLAPLWGQGAAGGRTSSSLLYYSQA